MNDKRSFSLWIYLLLVNLICPSVKMCQNEAKKTASMGLLAELMPKLSNTTILGVGSGSTVMIFIQCLVENVRSRPITPIKCIPTSFQTKQELLKHPDCFSVVDWDFCTEVDLYVDGADAFDEELNLIKGRGGALFQEKLAYLNSKLSYILVDWSKEECFSHTPIPIEVIPMALPTVLKKLNEIGIGKVTVREGSGKVGPVITDNGNFLIDAEIDWSRWQSVRSLENEIKRICGVVESGLFSAKQNLTIILARESGGISRFQK